MSICLCLKNDLSCLITEVYCNNKDRMRDISISIFFIKLINKLFLTNIAWKYRITSVRIGQKIFRFVSYNKYK